MIAHFIEVVEFQLPSLKLTSITPENGWLDDEFPFGARPVFKCELLVLQCVVW